MKTQNIQKIKYYLKGKWLHKVAFLFKIPFLRNLYCLRSNLNQTFHWIRYDLKSQWRSHKVTFLLRTNKQNFFLHIFVVLNLIKTFIKWGMTSDRRGHWWSYKIFIYLIVNFFLEIFFVSELISSKLRLIFFIKWSMTWKVNFMTLNI